MVVPFEGEEFVADGVEGCVVAVGEVVDGFFGFGGGVVL